MLSSPRAQDRPPATQSLEPSPPLVTNHLLNFECEAGVGSSRACVNERQQSTNTISMQSTSSIASAKVEPMQSKFCIDSTFSKQKSIKLNKNHHINRPSSTDSHPTASECSYVSSYTGPGREVRDDHRHDAQEAAPTRATAQILAIDVKPQVSKRRQETLLSFFLPSFLFINILFSFKVSLSNSIKLTQTKANRELCCKRRTKPPIYFDLKKCFKDEEFSCKVRLFLNQINNFSEPRKKCVCWARSKFRISTIRTLFEGLKL